MLIKLPLLKKICFGLIKYLKFDKERIIICHVNHHLRNDSDIDESFVSILGNKLNIDKKLTLLIILWILDKIILFMMFMFID